eukprot:gene12901-14231_t
MPPPFTMVGQVMFSVALAIIMVVGVVGNILIAVIFTWGQDMRQMQRSTRLLITHLAIADMILAFGILVHLLNLNKVNVNSIDAICQYSGFSCNGLVITSIWLITIIAINRYSLIVKRGFGFKDRSTFIWLAVAWVLPAGVGIGPVLGWSRYIARPRHLICQLQSLEPQSFAVVYLLAFIAPVPFLTFCTISILNLLRKQNKVLHGMQTEEPGPSHRQNINSNRQTLMLLVVIVGFVICYLPINILKIIRNRTNMSKIPSYVDALLLLLCLSNHAINPIIYGIMNTKFRQTLIRMISTATSLTCGEVAFLADCVLVGSSFCDCDCVAAMTSLAAFLQTTGPFGKREVEQSGFAYAILLRNFSTYQSTKDGPSCLCPHVQINQFDVERSCWC